MSRQAIRTKFLGPTNHHGARIAVTCDAKRIYVTWDDAQDPLENHTRAAKLLATMLGWHGTWYAGSAKNDPGYTFVVADFAAFKA